MTQTKKFATESEKIASECAATKSTPKVEDEQYPFIFDTPEQKELFEKGSPGSSEQLIDPMLLYNSAEEARAAIDKYGLFVVGQPSQTVPIFDCKEEIPPYEDEEPKGYFDYAIMPENRNAAEIVRNSVSVGKVTPKEETLDASKTVIASLKKQIQHNASENDDGIIPMKKEINYRKPIVYKPTSNELASMIICSIPMFICEEQLYMRQSVFYQRKSYADLQRAIKTWLKNNNMPEVRPSQVNEIISLIYMEESLVKQASDLNQHFIAFHNGLLNIYDGSFYLHSPQHLITYLIDCNYIPNQISCPCFNEFLHTATGGDMALQTRIWQMLGYLISPDTRGKVIFLLQGISNSGKSVLVDLIKSLFSSEAVMPLDAHKMGARFLTSNLVGKALCLSGDMTADPLNADSTSKLKQFSGNDFISSDVKHSAMVSFYGRAKFVLITNHPLLTTERDDAFVERIITIPFNYAVPPERRDRDLIDKLKAERDSIVTIAVQYYFDLVKNKYRFEGEYAMNASTGILQNHTEEKDVEANVYKFIRLFFEPAEDGGIYTDDAHRIFINEFGYIDKKHFSVHFSEISYQLFGTAKERRRRSSDSNPISYIAGIRLKGGTQL